MKPELFRAEYEELTSCLPEKNGRRTAVEMDWVPTQTIAIRRYAIPFSGAHIILASYRSHYIRIKRYVVYHKNSLDPREILQEKPFG